MSHSDSTHGPLIGVLSDDTARFKEGGLSAGWGFVGLSGAATALAVASDPINGPLIGVTDTSGTAWVKEGGLSTDWVDEYAGENALALASDSANGPVIGIISSGTAYAKDGGLSTGWVNETAGGDVPVAIQAYGQTGQYLCAVGSDSAGYSVSVTAGSSSNPTCQWTEEPESGGSFAFLNVQAGAFLTWVSEPGYVFLSQSVGNLPVSNQLWAVNTYVSGGMGLLPADFNAQLYPNACNVPYFFCNTWQISPLN